MRARSLKEDASEVKFSDSNGFCASKRGLSHRFGQLYLLRIAYCVLRIAYCVKHDIISVIFNDTVQDDISRGLAETMIMALITPSLLGRKALSRDQ